MKRRNLIIANWKMNPETLEESKKIFNSIRAGAKQLKNTDVAVCPPLPFIAPLSKLTSPKNLFLGAQSSASERKGAFTGEVSASMLKSSGVEFVLVGHSERRAMGETNETVRKKLQIAFDSGLIPVLCIGEKERDKEAAYLGFLKNQLKECLIGLQKKHLVGIHIAYEPIWAIGRSWREAMTPTDIHETVLLIQKMIGESFGRDIAASIRVLYGGSVEIGDAESIMLHGNVDGLLVGHASLIPEEFTRILKACDIKR